MHKHEWNGDKFVVHYSGPCEERCEKFEVTFAGLYIFKHPGCFCESSFNPPAAWAGLRKIQEDI